MANYSKTDLFGGAIVVDLPSRYVDVSDLRPVPDNQEIYLDMDGFSSITFDLTQRPDSVATDEEALKLHLEDILDSGDGAKVWYQKTACLAHFPEQTPAYTVFATTHTLPGENVEARRGQLTPVFTGLLVTLIRLEAKKTDIVITANVPHIRGNYDEGNLDLEQGQLGALLDAALAHQDRIYRTFEVKDWNLFV
ncbi:MAG: multicopy suppressor of ts gsp1 [Geoglossum umbratile]|nr:MAG: multicopy suppressor of ts gsp1 [Geoglossum umbratile]